MPFTTTAALQAIASFAETHPEIAHAMIGEPRHPPLEGIVAAIFMDGARTPESVLDATIRVYDVTIRLYLSFLEDGTATEIAMSDAVSLLMSDLEADTDLNDTVRHVDVAGIYGRSLGAEWGYLDVDGVMFRTADIVVPLIVDQAAGSLAA
jgi:hypothetical protein